MLLSCGGRQLLLSAGLTQLERCDSMDRILPDATEWECQLDFCTTIASNYRHQLLMMPSGDTYIIVISIVVQTLFWFQRQV